MSYIDEHIKGLSEEDIARILESDDIEITKGNFNGFIDFLKQNNSGYGSFSAHYICVSPPKNAKMLLKKLLGCFGLAELNIKEMYELIKDNAGHTITRVSKWNISEIDLLNDISNDLKIKCCTADFKHISKWGYEGTTSTYKIVHNNKKILWVNKTYKSPDYYILKDKTYKYPEYFILKNNKIYGIEYHHGIYDHREKTLTIYKNIENKFCDFIADTDIELDKIISAYDKEITNTEKIEIDSTPYFIEMDLTSYFYKGFFYRNNLAGDEISQIKSIEFAGRLLKIEIENLTYPHCGYILLDIENAKITDAYPPVKGQRRYNKSMKTTKSPGRHNKTALPRFYKIDREIALGKFPNSDDLAELCETSISTISRDIEFMRDQLDAPIEYDPLNRGYYYTQKTYRLPGGFSSAEDLLALGMAKSILSLYAETPLFEASKHLLESIIAPIASDGNRDWLENRIIVPPVASAKVDTAIWETVIAGLKGNRILTFDYLGTWDEDYQKRRLHPYQLLFDSGVWYLYGFSEERRAIRIFSLSRIKNIVLTKDTFQLPENFSYTDSAGGSYFGVFIGQEKYKFAVECYAEAEIFAAERQWADDQKITRIDGGIKIEFTSTQYGKVLKWLLSCGCDTVPRKPKKLVDEWKRHIAEMNKLVSK